jgi:hypothetical protein
MFQTSNIDSARNKARELIQIAADTGRNPNDLARTKSAGDITLSEAYAQYRQHLLGRSKPAKANTLAVFDKALARLVSWHDTKIKDLLQKTF